MCLYIKNNKPLIMAPSIIDIVSESVLISCNHPPANFWSIKSVINLISIKIIIINTVVIKLTFLIDFYALIFSNTIKTSISITVTINIIILKYIFVIKLYILKIVK